MFAAFVWHEGIVHDAMAVASYLKFHPNITKHGNVENEDPDETKVGDNQLFFFDLFQL